MGQFALFCIQFPYPELIFHNVKFMNYTRWSHNFKKIVFFFSEIRNNFGVKRIKWSDIQPLYIFTKVKDRIYIELRIYINTFND